MSFSPALPTSMAAFRIGVLLGLALLLASPVLGEARTVNSPTTVVVRSFSSPDSLTSSQLDALRSQSTQSDAKQSLPGHEEAIGDRTEATGGLKKSYGFLSLFPRANASHLSGAPFWPSLPFSNSIPVSL